MRAGITTDVAATIRQTGDMVRRTSDLDHVNDAHADVLGGDVAAAEMVDRLAEDVEHVGGLVARFVGENY